MLLETYMKWSVVFLIAFIAAWFLNSHVLLYFFPYTNTEEYYKFIAARNVAYETMFLTLIVGIYIESKGLLKALSCFIMILVLASVIDKAVFKITTYLYSDLVLILIALAASYMVYGRNK